MRKFLAIVLLSLAIISSFSQTLQAEETKEDKLSTLIILKNDWMFPSSGPSYDVQHFSGYWHYKNFGAGLDVDYVRKTDYLQVKPYMTLNKGPWYLVGGFAADNFSQWVQAGFWYINNFGDWSLTVDSRNYFSVGGKAESYIDNFIEVTHPLGKKFFFGADVIYDHWWEGQSHDWFLVGPLVGYKLTKEMSVFVRLSREWDSCGGKTKEADSVRLGVMFNF